LPGPFVAETGTPIVRGDIRPENIFVHLASGDTVLVKPFDFAVLASLEGGDVEFERGF
jgi:hypothetical protein